MAKYRIAIAEDHEMIRESIVSLIEDKLDVDVVLSSGDGNHLLGNIDQASPDLLILDVNMPKKDGVEVTKAVKSKFPDIKILVWTSYDDLSLIMKLVKMKVNGYITKDSSLDEFISAIKAIMGNGYYLNENMSVAMYNSAAGINSTEKSQEKYVKLDEVDQKILRLICEELTTKEIAHQLHLSSRTIEGRKKRMMLSLNVKNQIGLAIYAIKNNIFPG